MQRSFFYEKNQKLIKDIAESDFKYIIVGSGGWIGTATIEYLAEVLGDTIRERVVLLGSTEREYETQSGFKLSVQKLENSDSLLINENCIVLHYAFLTMDKVNTMSTDEYVSQNETIRHQVLRLVDRLKLKGLSVLSSGAVYDFLKSTRTEAAQLYGRLKYQDEYFFESAARLKGASYVCPRVFNISGPYINKPEVYALASFIMKGLCSLPIDIRAAHPVIRSWLPVQSLIELQFSVLHESSIKYEKFDFSGDEVLEVGDIAKIIAEKLNVPINRNPDYVHSTPADMYLGDSDKVNKLVSFYNIAKHGIAEQIDNTISFLNSSR